MRYESATLDDLATILKDSIVRYKGEPVYIQELKTTAMGIKCVVTALDNLEQSFISLNSKFLDLTPVPIGCCNTPTGSVFITRRPSRSYRQGLSFHNVYIRNFDAEPNYISNMGSLRIAEMKACIKGVYPKIEEAIVIAKEKRISCAFSRTHRISPSGELYHRTEQIGIVDFKTGIPSLLWDKEVYRRTLK
jgi:hypothetical protein